MERRREQEHYKIQEGVFDQHMMKLLVGLANNGFFDCIDYCISTGKEADVYRATIKGGGFVALKLYRVETSFFRSMADYINGDPRFERIRKSKRSLVEIWCQKEFRNLNDAIKAGVRVPMPHGYRKNVLIMEFIGDGGIPAQLLKDVRPKDPQAVVDEIAKWIKDLWEKAGIVHADISEFNVLMNGETPYLIDIGQGVSVKHPKAHDFLVRDVHNLERMAKMLGVKWDAKKFLEKMKA